MERQVGQAERQHQRGRQAEYRGQRCRRNGQTDDRSDGEKHARNQPEIARLKDADQPDRKPAKRAGEDIVQGRGEHYAFAKMLI